MKPIRGTDIRTFVFRKFHMDRSRASSISSGVLCTLEALEKCPNFLAVLAPA